MWRLGKYLSSLTKPELEVLQEKCNFTDDEAIIFNMLTKNKGIKEISFKTGMSEATVNRRVSDIKRKVGKINGCQNYA